MWWRSGSVAAFVLVPGAFLLANVPRNSGVIQVTGVRSWSHADSTRVIIEMTGPFEFKSDRAVGPDRLFFDIFHAEPWIAHRRFASHEIGDGLVKRVRIAETAPHMTRIVFDLVSPAEFKVSRLEAPDRMVIEVRPVGPAPRLSVTSNSTTPRPFEPAARKFIPPPPRQVVFPPAPPVMLTLADLPPVYLPDPMATIAVRPPKSGRTVSTRVIPASRPVADRASTTSANASRSLTRALGLKVNRIVIDAGHGGHDDGTIGPHGVLEKDVVLDVAMRLSKMVQEKMGAEVVLTRSDDTFIPLHERTAIANEHKADLFLSIHANSSPSREVAGTETFYLNFTSSPGAIDVAARENAGSDKSVGELKDLIQTITMNEKIEESHTFAQEIQTAIQSQAARANPAAHNRGVKKAPFVVLIGASMPSVLAEIGFLSNAKDESNLRKPEYRQKVAEALYKGLAQYAQSLSHFEVARQVVKADKPAPAGLAQ
jgi:N-acetylmuramoyl-L-alanine amidase